MKTQSHILKNIALLTTSIIICVSTSFAQDSRCLCAPNNDEFYVLPEGAVEYSISKTDIDKTMYADGGGSIDVNGGTDTLHLMGAGKTYSLSGNFNKSPVILIHEGVTVEITKDNINSLHIYNRGTITRDGNLRTNEGSKIVNSGTIKVIGAFGDLNGSFINYGYINAQKVGSIQSGVPSCMGNSAIIEADFIGDLNAKFGNVESGGTFIVGKEIKVNRDNVFDLADELTIYLKEEATESPLRSENLAKWGKVTFKDISELNTSCNFFPTISPTTFKANEATTFTASVRGGGSFPAGAKIHWLVNDVMVEDTDDTKIDSDGITFTYGNPEITDKISFVVEVGSGENRCVKSSNGVTMSPTINTPTVTLQQIGKDDFNVCTPSDPSVRIPIEAIAKHAGFMPKFKWTLNGDDNAAITIDSTNKCPFTFANLPTDAQNATITVELITHFGSAGSCEGNVYQPSAKITDSQEISLSGSVTSPEFNLITSICSLSGTSSIDLSKYVGTPISGTFSGEGVSGNSFTPTRIGKYEITYEGTEGDCIGSTTKSINVYDLPTPQLTATTSNSIANVTLTTTALSNVTSVEFQYRQSGSSEWKKIETKTESPYTVTKQLGNGNWEFQSILTSDYGCSISSEPQTVVIQCSDCITPSDK